MSLARAWTRQLFGASEAAVLVPGTVACALAVIGAGTSLTSKVPGPIGPPATQTPESVGAAVDNILPQ